MPELKNARQEKFALLVAQAEGTNGDAYVKAGYVAKDSDVAQASASKLLGTARIGDRVAELKRQWALAAGVTTTDMVAVLDGVARYDIADIMDWRWEGKGRRRRMVAEVRNLRDIPQRARLGIKAFKMTPDGPQIVFSERVAAARLVGQHLGMFQGENAGALPGATYNDNRTLVYVDAPPPETVEQWQARVAKQRRTKIVEGKVNAEE